MLHYNLSSIVMKNEEGVDQRVHEGAAARRNMEKFRTTMPQGQLRKNATQLPLAPAPRQQGASKKRRKVPSSAFRARPQRHRCRHCRVEYGRRPSGTQPSREGEGQPQFHRQDECRDNPGRRLQPNPLGSLALHPRRGHGVSLGQRSIP